MTTLWMQAAQNAEGNTVPDGKDALGVAKSARELKDKTDNMANFASSIVLWADRLKAIRSGANIRSIEFDTVTGINMNYMVGDSKYDHEFQMIRDAMETVCEKQIEALYNRLHAMKDTI